MIAIVTYSSAPSRGPKSPVFFAMLTETCCSVSWPSTMLFILNVWIPSFVGFSLIITVPTPFSLIERACGSMLISSAQLSYPDAEITKLPSFPVFWIVAVMISSLPTSESESRDAVIVGFGAVQDRTSSFTT